MAATLPLPRGAVTLSQALTEEDDMCHQLSLVPKRLAFFAQLSNAATDIEAIVATHLARPQHDCEMVTDQKTWRYGSYNVCIPVRVSLPAQQSKQIVLVRIPQPYKIGEERQPGNADEKLRTEAATYIWMQDSCPSVPIPRLLGFGFPSGISFSPLETTSFLTQARWHLRRTRSWFLGLPSPCRYPSFQRKWLLNTGYLLLEYVEQGKQLCFKPRPEWEDQQRRHNLFHDLSKIMLTVARIPLPRIGCWTISDAGEVSLTNRPVTGVIQELENEGTPVGIPKDHTYESTDSYYLDILRYHDSRMKHRANMILNKADGEQQLAIYACMRAVLHHFTQGHRGPFLMQFTDVHQSNIFVNEDWHITKIIDLEWICSRPAEMLRAPLWLTNQPIDGLNDENLAAYNIMLDEFMDAFAAEESSMGASHVSLATTMRTAWNSGVHWYCHALDSPACVFAVFTQHIQTLFLPNSARYGPFFTVISFLWTANAAQFIQDRVADTEDYKKRLEALFAQGKRAPASSSQDVKEACTALEDSN